MKTPRARLLTLMLLPAALATAQPAAPVAQVPESVDAALLPNYVAVRPGLASAGTPTEEGLRQLKAMGFRTVIDLRTSVENGLAEEKARVEAEGLAYVNVPVTAASFRPADVDAIQAALDAPGAGPVLMHCASANRVGAVWAVMQVRKGKSLEQAEAEGREIGLNGAAMIEAMKRVAGQPAAPR